MALKRMLLPIGSEVRDRKLLQFACGLTAQGVRELLVVNVVDASTLEPPVLIREVERARQEMLEIAAPYAECGMSIEVRVVTGEVFDSIMAAAHQGNVDVICCATEGKSFIDYLFSGSISEDLALKGDERTMSVHYDVLLSEEDAGEVARRFARRLVVPTDFSGSAMRAFLSAFDRPKEAIGTVHLVHVLSDDESRADAEAHMVALRSLAEENEVDVVCDIIGGNPQTTILDYMRDIGATGVITGRRGRSRIGRGLLGSVSMKLLQEAPVPVVIQP